MGPWVVEKNQVGEHLDGSIGDVAVQEWRFERAVAEAEDEVAIVGEGWGDAFDAGLTCVTFERWMNLDPNAGDGCTPVRDELWNESTYRVDGDGKANAHLCRWLAKQCKIAKSNVTVTHGLTNRHKQVQIDAPQQLPDWLTPYLPH